MSDTLKAEDAIAAAGKSEPAFLSHPLLDRLVESVMVLTAELWVERDRRRILEELLKERGILSAADIESYAPAAEQDAERARLRSQLTHRVLGPMAKTGD